MPERKEAQRERTYVLLRYDGHTYKRVGELESRSPDTALDEWVSKNEGDAGHPFMTVPKRFTELRRVSAKVVKQMVIERVDESQSFDVPLPLEAERV